MGMIDVLIKGQLGQMDESLLEKREGNLDNEHERTTWVEYWYEGELVHRSVHVTLKESPTIGSVVEGFR